MANSYNLNPTDSVTNSQRPISTEGGRETLDPKDREILDKIYKDINSYYRFNENNINRFRNDRYFLFYDQWSQIERQAFKDLNKPIFTYNKLYDYYRKLIGEQRFNTYDIEITSINGLCAQKDITLRGDIIRGIEAKSHADIAYQTAFASAVSGGLGAIRLRTDYLNAKSFEQEIFIEPVIFAERVFYDPISKTATKTDGSFMGEYEQMKREDFIEKYPNIPYPTSFPVNYNTRFFNWGDKQNITICQYFRKEWFNFTLYQLDNGQTVTKKEYLKMKKDYEAGIPPEENNDQDEDPVNNEIMAQSPMAPQQPLQPPQQQGMPGQPQQPPMPQQMPMQQPQMAAGIQPLPQIVTKRKSRDYKIMGYKAIAGHILEKSEWPSKEFPYAMVLGDEVTIDGEQIIVSLTRYAKDPQRFVNFLASDLAQAAKNNRREQFLATADNIAGYERFWKNPANMAGVLPYNPDSITKEKPERLPVPELPNSLVINIQQADKDLRSIIGYPQEMGGQSFGQLTGKAIREMQRVGHSSNLVFFANLERAQEQIGRTILKMLPKIYDTQRILPAIGVNGKSRQVTVNKPIAGGMTNSLFEGDFDITVSSGASYAVQKEEALQAITQLIAGWNPQVSPLVADILAKNIDIEDNIELVNRFKTLIPPQVTAQMEGKPPPPPPPPSPDQQLQQQKLKLGAMKEQNAQAAQQNQQQLNQVKLESAQMEFQATRIRALSEAQNAGLNYKASIAESAAKVAAAHATISDKHFEAVKHIHDLTSSDDLVQAPKSGDKNPIQK
jgi:hypothetical protein